jgi:hypothetical protein
MTLAGTRTGLSRLPQKRSLVGYAQADGAINPLGVLARSGPGSSSPSGDTTTWRGFADRGWTDSEVSLKSQRQVAMIQTTGIAHNWRMSHTLEGQRWQQHHRSAGGSAVRPMPAPIGCGQVGHQLILRV